MSIREAGDAGGVLHCPRAAPGEYNWYQDIADGEHRQTILQHTRIQLSDRKIGQQTAIVNDMLLVRHRGPVSPFLKWPGCLLAIGLGLYTIHAAVQEIRFGRLSSRRKKNRDDLLEKFMPEWNIAEMHKVFLECKPAEAYRLACNLDPMQLPLVRFIFRIRSFLLGGTNKTPPRTGGLVPYTRSIGWATLAEIQDREIVMGSATRPWEANVNFRSIQPEQFAAFRDPDFVKIVWTLRSDSTPGGTLFRTETRALATDANARRKFRLYWAVFSPGIILIRRYLLSELRREARRQTFGRIAGPVLA